ncbi:thermonuclease family protein [Segetibacter sp. 3557_3]|uniref:thermonuclease family protein n=1 Tax=Segetibacter sp. 3557_3 TaxID=2547429 RepID=UPI00140548AC|nr:thermonuclease family protein [Segetibacter sp. 3557_3]
MRYIILIWFFAFLSCKEAKNHELATTITGKVIKVKDGDTIDILFENKPLTIRFADIDCPEKSQPFGKAARQFVSAKCFGQVVTIKHLNKYDRWHRLVGTVLATSGENINISLLQAGLAWHYKKYSNNPGYSVLEQEAKQRQLGVWSEVNAVAPWDWR